jgi:hypothetical protein
MYLPNMTLHETSSVIESSLAVTHVKGPESGDVTTFNCTVSVARRSEGGGAKEGNLMAGYVRMRTTSQLPFCDVSEEMLGRL